MQEKRESVRIEAPVVVAYKLRGKAPMTKKTITKDFSERGIRFPIYEKLKIGAPLEFYIQTPLDKMPIAAAGQVVWISPLSKQKGREIYDTGVKFTKMQALDKQRMARTTRYFFSMGKRHRPG